MIVIFSGSAITLIIILICCLICLKIRGDNLAKVEQVTRRQALQHQGTNDSPMNAPQNKIMFGDEDDDGNQMQMAHQGTMFKTPQEQQQFMQFFKKL
mmetsp:Transcript_35922/g.55168  ORF Transcript_35922/g.55168 Transcript_35922/m.55168 type:complete len:97 (+) Transcript_35922:772-1062(+)